MESVKFNQSGKVNFYYYNFRVINVAKDLVSVDLFINSHSS